jgi:hypothetical protein
VPSLSTSSLIPCRRSVSDRDGRAVLVELGVGEIGVHDPGGGVDGDISSTASGNGGEDHSGDIKKSSE